MTTLRRLARPMTSRDREEEHRASTPLELLFDLSFVVAVSAAAASLHEGLAEGQVGHSVLGYLTVFFAIWWAWMNFTWFASAYDTDDVPYRLLTLLQIAGVLVLAVGVPEAFDGDLAKVTAGYVIMRVALLTQWLRAARTTGGTSSTAFRYAVLIALVQIGWVGRLWLPDSFGTITFVGLAICEMLVPIVAERWGGDPTPWHPEHIAERYGLFTIIVIGESILSATDAIREGLTEGGVSLSLLGVAAGGLVAVFGIWWLYFQRAAAEGLREIGGGVFAWGYAHYVLFAALAGLGAGLTLASQNGEAIEASARLQALAVAVPVALALALLAVMQGRLHGEPRRRTLAFVGGAVVVVAVGLIDAIPLGLDIGLMAAAVSMLVAIDIAHVVERGEEVGEPGQRHDADVELGIG